MPTNDRKVTLGIAGLGTVAQGVLQIIKDNGALIRQRTGIDLVAGRVASRTPRPDVDLLGAEFDTHLDSLCTDDVDIVLELIGGEDAAHDLVNAATAAGKPVVTANKALIATHGNTLLGGVSSDIRYEAAVAGAIPIIQALRDALVANRFEYVVGIINGTCNYILTAMQEQGASFDNALAEAQALGYAEADPTFDVDGIDAAHKLTILFALAFDTPFDLAHVHVEGIREITAEDITYADELGYRIKHLGIARATPDGLEARVHPSLVPKEQLLASVNGVANAVLVKSDAAGSTLFSGPGAGSLATASAVLADVISIATGVSTGSLRGDARAAPHLVAAEDFQCAFYLRIPTLDEPGVFAQIANALSGHGISIEAAIQKQPASSKDIVAIVIVTQEIRESAMVAALQEVEALDEVVGPVARIRIELLH